MHRLRQIPEYNDMEIALSTVEEENKAKKILSENVEKFRNCVASNFEIIDLNADLNRQRSFNSIIACDGSTLRFEKTSGNLEKFAITANSTGGHTNINKFKTVSLHDVIVIKPHNHPKDVAKLTMQDMEYYATALSAMQDSSSNYVHLVDGAIGSLLWSISKMNHFDKGFTLNSDPSVMQTLVSLATEGMLAGSPKKVSNVNSKIIDLLKVDIPNVDLLSEKYILSKILNNNELIIASTDGKKIVNQVSTSGFGRKTNDGYTTDSELVNLITDYKSLFIENYRSVFLKIGGNPYPIKLEFLNPSMLNNFNFLKGIEIEMAGTIPIPFPQYRADKLAKSGRKLAKRSF